MTKKHTIEWLAKTLLETEIQFQIRTEIPKYNFKVKDGEKVFYIVFNWNEDHRRDIGTYLIRDFPDKLECKYGKATVRRGSGFLYYSMGGGSMWTYNVYASVHCTDKDTTDLDTLYETLLTIQKAKNKTWEDHYDKESLRKDLKKLVDLGIVKEHANITDKATTDIIKEITTKGEVKNKIAKQVLESL